MELFSFLVFIFFVILLWEEAFTKETFMSRIVSIVRNVRINFY